MPPTSPRALLLAGLLLAAASAAHADESPLDRAKRLSGIPAATPSSSSPAPFAAAAPCWTKKSAATGKEVSAFKELDQNVRAFMQKYAVPAGNLVVRYRGTVVLERGYGWKDAACKTKMPYDGMFRVASLTKPVTNAMLLNLLAAGRLHGDDRVFCVNGNSQCLLTIPGMSTAADARVRDITVQQLMDHQGGWDRSLSGDPVFDVRNIATVLGVASPPSKTDMVRYVLSKPLDFAPGSQSVYSNFGYMVLGLVIEKVAAKRYYAQLQADLLDPLAIKASDMKGAGSLEMDVDPREPFYSTPWNPDKVRSVFDKRGPRDVPLAYGGWDMESLGAAGGLLASTRAYSRFLSRYWISGDDKQRAPCGNCVFLFFGSLPGTATLALQRGSDVDVALFFDQREDAQDSYFGEMYQTVDAALGKITQWPTKPPKGHKP